MTRNKININRKEISSDKIREQENFEGVVNNHQKLTKRPAYRQKKYYFLLFLILLIAFLIYSSDKTDETKEKKITTTEQAN